MCKVSRQMLAMSDPALDYFRHVLAVRGWNANELAQKAGVSHSTINRPLTAPDWKSRISRKTIEAVAAASGIDPAPFVGAVTVVAVASDLIPIYNVTASAGHGALVGPEEIVDQLSFPPGYLRHVTKANPKNLAIIGVKGDSMVPTLKDDDLVMLDRSKTDLSYDGLFVIRDGGDALLVKRITRAASKDHVLIKSDNAAMYPPVERHLSDVHVVGKVVWMGVKV